MLFTKKEKHYTELASYFTISNFIKNEKEVFFKFGRKNRKYILTSTEEVLEEVKRSFVGADVFYKRKKWYVCIPLINDII